jgi:hypothetical protein
MSTINAQEECDEGEKLQPLCSCNACRFKVVQDVDQFSDIKEGHTRGGQPSQKQTYPLNFVLLLDLVPRTISTLWFIGAVRDPEAEGN